MDHSLNLTNVRKLRESRSLSQYGSDTDLGYRCECLNYAASLFKASSMIFI